MSYDAEDLTSSKHLTNLLNSHNIKALETYPQLLQSYLTDPRFMSCFAVVLGMVCCSVYHVMHSNTWQNEDMFAKMTEDADEPAAAPAKVSVVLYCIVCYCMA